MYRYRLLSIDTYNLSIDTRSYNGNFFELCIDTIGIVSIHWRGTERKSAFMKATTALQPPH